MSEEKLSIIDIPEKLSKNSISDKITIAADDEYNKIIKSTNIGLYILCGGTKRTTFLEEFGETIVFLLITECLKQGLVGYDRKLIYESEPIERLMEEVHKATESRITDPLYLKQYSNFFLLNVSVDINNKNIQLLSDVHSVEEFVLNKMNVTVHSFISIKTCSNTQAIGMSFARLLDGKNTKEINNCLTVENKKNILYNFIGIIDAVLFENNEIPFEAAIAYLSLAKCRMNAVRYVAYEKMKIKTSSINIEESTMSLSQFILNDLGIIILLDKYK